MKKIFFLLALVVMMFSACSEGTDFDIDYTPIAPIGGQYALNIEKGYDPSKTDAEYWDSNPSDVEEICNVSDGVFGFLSNTTDYDKDKAWIRIGNYSTATEWAINAKVSINMSDYIFSGTDVDNFIGNSATSKGKITVSGKCGHNTYMTATGTITDEITIVYSRADQPGYHYRAKGFKYTGWDEDLE